MVDLTDDEIDAALQRDRAMRMTEPRIVDVRYDRTGGRMTVELTNGCTFLFPPRSLQGLETASDEEIAAVEILGSGSGLHWETGGAYYTIAGRFGTKAYMDALHGEVLSSSEADLSLKAG